jgi:hypothetical protein
MWHPVSPVRTTVPLKYQFLQEPRIGTSQKTTLFSLPVSLMILKQSIPENKEPFSLLWWWVLLHPLLSYSQVSFIGDNCFDVGHNLVRVPFSFPEVCSCRQWLHGSVIRISYCLGLSGSPVHEYPSSYLASPFLFDFFLVHPDDFSFARWVPTSFWDCVSELLLLQVY